MNAVRTPGRKTRPTVSSMDRRRWFVRRNRGQNGDVRRSTRSRSKRVLFDPSSSSPTTVSAVEIAEMRKSKDEDETESDTETEDDSEDDSDYSIELGSQDTDDEDEIDEVDGFLIVSSRQRHN